MPPRQQRQEPSEEGTSAPLLGRGSGDRHQSRRHEQASHTPARSARERQAELAATFEASDEEDDNFSIGGDDDDDAPAYGSGRSDALPTRGRPAVARAAATSPGSGSPPGYASPMPRQEDDVFFDAGDALGAAEQQGRGTEDPLGANRPGSSDERPQRNNSANEARQTATRDPTAATTPATYDFENTNYFAPPRSNLRSSRTTSRAVSPDRSAQREGGEQAGALDGSDGMTPLARARHALGRFGRLVGMRVPGATYSTLTNENDGVSDSRRRRVVGSGIGQDGVFANLNAKPERRRRRGTGGDDRGEDDDLAEDTLPPSYATAAADAAPPYWETTIIGGPGGLHPLAPGGMGWTPGGAHVGALEDLIIDGLPLGNFFGFAWNLLVSMSFQFVGFLLTYLLHTTHAARCGSRAGLGITLVQYGFYLRTRAQQLAEGKPLDDGLAPLPPPGEPQPTGQPGVHVTAWWGDMTKPQATETVGHAARGLATRGLDLLLRGGGDAPAPGGNSTLADALAADNGSVRLPSNESMSASTEYLAYILMGLGWFILLTSLLSYWRVHRWGAQLVAAAQRDTESAHTGEGANPSTEDGAEASDPNAPVGFIHALQRALRNGRRGANGRNSRQGRRTHTGEDWIIYPGRMRRDLAAAGHLETTNGNTELPVPVTTPGMRMSHDDNFFPSEGPLSSAANRRLLGVDD